MLETVTKKEATVLFAGDSGDGIQLTGTQFTDTTALYGNDLNTFPNFPAEIRAPQGTLAGVSGFQIQFGSIDVFTPGDQCDVLVVMNAAALKTNLLLLKKGGIIIANTAGFDAKNLRLSKYEFNPLEDDFLSDYKVHSLDITKLTRNTLKESGSSLGQKEADRSKNMFVLGFIFWLFNRPLNNTIAFLETKFASKEGVKEANIGLLKAGYNFGETSETFSTQIEVKPARLKTGVYRNIQGNEAIAIGLIAAAKKSGLELFYGSYPITPASSLLHELSKHKNFGIKTFQAEDEIAAICSSIGASYGGALACTGSSGPGIALKGEALGLAMMLEIPLVIVNIQRGGPSTGLPTKTEQSDLLQAMFGRNGASPIPILAAASPSDCFQTAYDACKMALEHMTPVLLLSDGYIANGMEPWQFPTADSLKEIEHKIPKGPIEGNFLPYQRDKNLVRKWAIPGLKGYQHRIGGLEKEDLTGNVSYDPDNHEKMTEIRAQKINNIAHFLPNASIDSGHPNSKLAILGWGSTYGAIKTAVRDLNAEGIPAAHIHLKNLHPFPPNLKEVLEQYELVLVPEINDGQLIVLLKNKFDVVFEPLNKVKGLPFTSTEILRHVKTLNKALLC